MQVNIPSTADYRFHHLEPVNYTIINAGYSFIYSDLQGWYASDEIPADTFQLSRGY